MQCRGSSRVLTIRNMKIEFSNTTKMRAAIGLANKQRFYDALCLFAQLDSYESLLNQIACLCEMEDTPYAVDLYRLAKQKYCATHAVYADVKSFGEVTETILNFCENDKKYAAKCDGKIRADKSLLIDFSAFYDDDDFGAPDLNYAADSVLYEDPTLASNNFFDVKSTQYFDSLRVNMEKCFMNGDEAGAKRYGKRLLDLDTDHLPTLEAQISLILYLENYKKGIVYAERLANAQGGSHAAVGGAIDIIMRTNPQKHTDTLAKLIAKAVEVINDVQLYDLEDYVYIATNYLHDVNAAYKFACVLFENYKNASLEALKMCACAFYNSGDTQKAKDAAISLLRAVPTDCYAKILWEFIKRMPYSKNQLPMDLAPRVLRHFCLPTRLTVYANAQLCRRLDVEGDLRLGSEDLFYVSVLMLHCKSLILSNQRKEYYEIATFLRALMATFLPEDNAEFVEFAKSQLLTTMSDQCLEESLVSRLISLGYKGKAFVGLTNGSYLLDFSKVRKVSKLFVDAFSICATLCRVDDAEKYLIAYKSLVERVQVNKKDPSCIHQVAYAMLCICRKNFSDALEADFFAENEADLYLKYVAAGS